MDLGSLRAHVTESSSVFVASSLSAVRRIADHGLPLIREGSVVMTHCNSDAALTLIERAFSVGRVTGVVATESRPWRQGHVTSVRLASHGVPVTLIVDPAANLMMEDAGAVIVGADTVASDGSLVNKIGTSLLALAAKENEVPFIVCAETFKFSIWARTGHDVVIEDRGPDEVADPLRTSDLPGVLFRNPVFDVTPPGNITRIVTEEGPISPRDVTGTVERLKRSLGLEVGHGGRSEHWLEDGPFIEEG
jgi:ribose 1,5-bisphosphate isomerase